MGTDIHIIIQVFDQQMKKWICLFDRHSADKTHSYILTNDIPSLDDFKTYEEYNRYTNHNVIAYSTFAKLGNVRNRWGISAPLAGRGLPKDFTEKERKELKNIILNDSRTHFTLEELKILDLSDIPICHEFGTIPVRNYNFSESMGENLKRETANYRYPWGAYYPDEYLRAVNSGKHQPNENDEIYCMFSAPYTRGIENLIAKGDMIAKIFSMPVRYIISFSN